MDVYTQTRLISLFTGTTSGSTFLGITGASIGIFYIVTSALLFIISNIAEDMHYQSYLTELYGEEQIKYFQHTAQLQQAIAEILYQQNESQAPVPDLSENQSPQESPDA